MKIHLVKEQSISDYMASNANSRNGFELWLSVLDFADWDTPEDIVNTYPTADLLGGGTNRVVFNIGGNKHRLICKYHFGAKQAHLFVYWMGTHADYNKLCNNEDQYTVKDY